MYPYCENLKYPPNLKLFEHQPATVENPAEAYFMKKIT